MFYWSAPGRATAGSMTTSRLTCGHAVCSLLSSLPTLPEALACLIRKRLRQRFRHRRYWRLCIYRCSWSPVRTLHEKAPFVIGHKINAVYRILERRTVSKNCCMSKFLSNVPVFDCLKNKINQFDLYARCHLAQGSVAPSGIHYLNIGLRQNSGKWRSGINGRVINGRAVSAWRRGYASAGACKWYPSRKTVIIFVDAIRIPFMNG